MILATLAEFSYIPTTWNSTFHLTHRLLFLLVTLALTGGPTFYIAIVEIKQTTTRYVLVVSSIAY